MLCENTRNLCLQSTRHVDLGVRIDKNIDFASNSKLFQVDSGFDRETRLRQDKPILSRLKVINVRSVAMRFFANVVAGAVYEELTIPRVFDDIPRRPVDFPALQFTIFCKS